MEVSAPVLNTQENNNQEHIYVAIDLKSFYASVECAERKLDAMTTNLVVADSSRTSKTICLAVSPSLKAHGIPGRARLFEVEQRVREVNARRLEAAIKLHKAVQRVSKTGRKEYAFASSSFDAEALEADPSLELSYIVAPPQMRRYMEVSASIYHIYLKYIAPEDIHVYSIDEVFMDVTGYLNTYHMTASELAMTMIREVLYTTGITATAGIGSNLYLCKVAMDIVAKHMPADENGVRIAELNERSYRELLWDHQPLTDFWRIGRGISQKLIRHGLYTMGDVARCSLGGPGEFHNEELLYKLFGVNAELLIDHAWGWEPCTIAEIKKYRPATNSLSSGQVLHCPYDAKKARLIVHEMIDLLALDLVEKNLVTDQLVLTLGYDIDNLLDPDRKRKYKGPIVQDHYGRLIPRHAHGTINLSSFSSSTRELTDAVLKLYDEIVNPDLLIRRVNIAACHLLSENELESKPHYEQMDLFTDYEKLERERAEKRAQREREKNMQNAMLAIKKKYGKNAILKGMNLEEGATTMQRNAQVGGHKA